MKAALVESFLSAPRYAEFRDPAAGKGEVLVKVRAAALSNLVRAQASGKHYSSGGEMPFVPGSDGVGTLPDGSRAYFFGPRAPFGSMAALSVVPENRTITLPEELDDVTAAALGNPGIATWGALIGRAGFARGEAVLVNGATGAAGQQAIQAAKFLGARRIVATGRNQEELERLRGLGADETVWLGLEDDALGEAFRRTLQTGIDVVLDYLWGRSAELLLNAAAGHGSLAGEPRIRYVQIGSMSGNTITLPGGLLRSSGVELLGSGLGSLSGERIREALERMFASAKQAGLRIETETSPLAEVEKRWGEVESGRRMVFVL